jgi:hypothetical protein
MIKSKRRNELIDRYTDENRWCFNYRSGRDSARNRVAMKLGNPDRI